MFFIRGTRQARIKSYQCNDRQCDSCKDFNLNIRVYKNYFHVFFIPVIASGVKFSVIKCNSCGSQIRSDSLSKEYESKTRIPFYLYSGIILAALFGLSLFAVNLWGQHERSAYISNPKVGDVYLIKREQLGLHGYGFVRLKRVTEDSVIAYDNDLIYLDLTSSFEPKDHFNTDQEVGYTKSQIKQLYEKGEIESVFRDYDEATGFNRVD